MVIVSTFSIDFRLWKTPRLDQKIQKLASATVLEMSIFKRRSEHLTKMHLIIYLTLCEGSLCWYTCRRWAGLKKDEGLQSVPPAFTLGCRREQNTERLEWQAGCSEECRGPAKLTAQTAPTATRRSSDFKRQQSAERHRLPAWQHAEKTAQEHAVFFLWKLCFYKAISATKFPALMTCSKPRQTYFHLQKREYIRVMDCQS